MVCKISCLFDLVFLMRLSSEGKEKESDNGAIGGAIRACANLSLSLSLLLCFLYFYQPGCTLMKLMGFGFWASCFAHWSTSSTCPRFAYA